MLWQLLLSDGHDRHVGTKYDGPRGRRALIDGEGRSSSCFSILVSREDWQTGQYPILSTPGSRLSVMLLDPRSRDWFRQPWPYIGAVLALAIFSPVIVWNADHNWASFIFQSTRRVEEPAWAAGSGDEI
jgi:hypothetical protein